MNRLLLLAVLGLAVCACEREPPPEEEESPFGLTQFDGIYEIDAWTENEEGCDAPGPSILEDEIDTHAPIREQSFFGARFIGAETCLDLEDCRTQAQDDAINLSGFSLQDGDDDEGWTGEGYFLGGGETCGGEVFTDALERVDEDTLLLTRSASVVEDVPLADEGGCDEVAAQEQAAEIGCTRLESLTLGFVEGF